MAALTSTKRVGVYHYVLPTGVAVVFAGCQPFVVGSRTLSCLRLVEQFAYRLLAKAGFRALVNLAGIKEIRRLKHFDDKASLDSQLKNTGDARERPVGPVAALENERP